MAAAEITRAETEERARLLHVLSCNVTLDLTKGAEVFGSQSVISFDCAEPGASSYADLVAQAVHEITLNGDALDPAAVWSDGRITLTGLAARNELRVVADCAYTRSGTGMHRSVDSADGKIYLYAKFEPAYARTVCTCFEQPDLKAEFTFHVVAPAHWTVLSNQPAPQPEPAGEGTAAPPRAVWHFPATPRMPSYNTTVVAGDYHVVRATHVTPGGREIPMELSCRASLAEYLDPKGVFDVTGKGLDYFAALFGTEYPFAKYGHAFVPEFSVGATEDAGCVLVSEDFLYRTQVTDAAYETRAMVVLHEMAHMWFGDLVTMKWWDDLWLNESFAEYCSYLSLAEATQFSDAWATFSLSRKSWGYQQDQLPSTHPVAADAPTLSEAIANFDGISYAKGASVLRQLVSYAGRPEFFAAIQDYFAAHGWANARLSDFLRAVEARSGKNLADWSKAWLQTAGPSTLRAEFSTGADGRFTRFALLQEAPAEHPTLRPHHISVGLYRRAGGKLERVRHVAADITGPRAELAELAGVPQPDLILLNDDDAGYALIRFDPRSLDTVIAAVGELEGALPRAVCWNAVIDMVQGAELSVPAFMAMLVRGIQREPSVTVIQILARQAELMMAQLADPAWVPEGKRQLAGVAEAMLRSAEPGGDHQLAWAQVLAGTATSPDQLDLVAGLLDGSVPVPGLTVNVELRWSMLLRLAATGRAGEERISAELATDATDTGRRNAAACLAAMPDAAYKEAAWQQLTGGELGVNSLVAMARAFNLPEHADLLTPYAGRYLPTMEKIWATGSGHMRVLLGDLLVPYPAASAGLVAQIDDYLAAGPRDPGLARVLVERRDLLQRALRSRALPAGTPASA